MTRKQAAQLVELLFAAFPFPRPPKDTLDLYAAELAGLDFEVARGTVQALVRGEERLPSIAVLLREYRAARRRLAAERSETHGLVEPIDPDNAAKARRLLERLHRSTKDVA